MGTLALCAKITRVPSMYLSELPGPRQGSRQAAIDGHREISRRCRALGGDSLVVFDSHWLVNASYYVNCAPHRSGARFWSGWTATWCACAWAVDVGTGAGDRAVGVAGEPADCGGGGCGDA